MLYLSPLRAAPSALDDPAHTARFEQRRQALALIALEHQRGAFDGAAAAERALERFEPRLQLLVGELELFDEGDFLAAAALAFEAYDGARGTSGRFTLGCRRSGQKLAPSVAERSEGIVERPLLLGAGGLFPAGRARSFPVAHARSQMAAKNPSVPCRCGRQRKKPSAVAQSSGGTRRQPGARSSKSSATSSFSSRRRVQVA